MFYLSVITYISSAHRLKEYQGVCQRIHGHNWKIKVQVKGNKLNDLGILIDFKDLRKISEQVSERIDHQFLNELERFKKINPSAENMARFFYKEIKILLPSNVKMDKIIIWETENYQLEYCE